MHKYFLLFILFLVGCSDQSNPSDSAISPIAIAINRCAEHVSSVQDCKQLLMHSKPVRALATAYTTDPHGYGYDILKLQEQLAQAQAQKMHNQHQTELQANIQLSAQQINERLALLKWFASPRSKR